MTRKEYRMEQKMKGWNMVFALLFLMLVWLVVSDLRMRGVDTDAFSLSDFIIMMLAVFRMIRLFVYDHITLFLREGMMDLEKKTMSEGDKFEYGASQNSLKRTVGKLLHCPWCFGIWAALLVGYSYLIAPEWRIVWIALALAGAASLLQVLANLIGWTGEYCKRTLDRMK